MPAKPTTLEQWLEYIQSIHFRSLNLSLDRVRRVKYLLRLERLPIIISIAGTNGKGSSAAMLESVLLSVGGSVGTYTSPHLTHYGERIRINGRSASDSQLVTAFAKVELARADIPLTYFEFGTLVALWLFQKTGVQIAILEVGMGGRLDAVNIETPDVSLLTNVGIDHEQWLGVGKERIGTEKAGILRFQGLAVINDPDPPGSVIDRVRRLRCRYLLYGTDYQEMESEIHWDWMFCNPAIWSVTPEFGLPKPGLRGAHQVQNAAGVVATLKLLSPVLSVSRGELEKGLKQSNIRGRLEIWSGSVEKIVDVCHNVAAVVCLGNYLSQQPVTGRTLVIFSMLKDKAAAAIVRELKNSVDQWYLTEIAEERAMPLVELKTILSEAGETAVCSCRTPEVALSQSIEAARSGDRIVIFGSTYLAGAILPLLDHENA